VREAPSIDLSRLAPDLGDTCEDYLTRYRRDFAETIARGEPGLATAARFSRVLDGLLSALHCAADAAAPERPGGRVALVAVGGYGRGLLGLYSDLDVLFLVDDPNDPHVRALAEGLLYPLWDLGVDIGHAVRGIDDTIQLSRDDIRTATTLLDLRRIAGDADIVKDLKSQARRQVFEPALGAFLDMLAEDTVARHDRFGGSLYLLEPEVKLGRGGLRDLDVVTWAAKGRWGTADHVRSGALLARERDELVAASELLWRVRNLLHLRAGRKQDRLTFADQEEIARELGFVDGVTLGVEQFMQAYYRHARVVAQTAERMLDRARPRSRRSRATMVQLGDGTAVFDDQITFEDTERVGREPVLALRLYSRVVERDRPPYAFARDAVARQTPHAEWRDGLQSCAEAKQRFLDLLMHVGRARLRRGSVIAELHEVGLTLAMIPELEPLFGRVQHDVFHVYTLDVHAVRATERLAELLGGKHTRTLSLASRLAAETPRRAPLFLAIFLHALGKVHGHSRRSDAPGFSRGARLVRPIGDRLGLSPVDVEHMAWLVQEQSSLYRWATQRDTSDPETLAEIAARVGSIERLRDLYLMTVCTLSTTNPGAMTAWKARMLEDLYFGLAAVLERGAPSTEGRAAELRKEILVGFVGDAQQAMLEDFVREMPDRYVLANAVDAVRRHARAVRDARGEKLAVVAGPGPSAELSELLVITGDRKGLLADAAAALAAHQVAVVDAQIYTAETAHGPRAFDVFVVRREQRGPGRGGEAVVDQQLARRVAEDLAARLEGEVSADELLARSPKQPEWARKHSPEVPTEVGIDNEVSPRFTVIEVFTRDRLGVLQRIAHTLHEAGLSIALSKVNTEGERIADVFYVHDEGEKLRDPTRVSTLHRALVDRLDEFHARAAEEGSL